MLDELFEDEAFADTVFVEDALDALARRMEAKGISRADLARELGVSKAAVSKFFASVDPKMQTFARYARAVGMVATVDLAEGKAAMEHVWKVDTRTSNMTQAMVNPWKRCAA